ncbi:MAG: DUF58 domain-containing protein [Solirubrobacterales bacterium]
MAGAATALRLALALLAGGLAFAAPVALLPGVALLLLIAGCSAWVRVGAAGLSGERIGVPRQVDEGEGFQVTIAGRSGWLPLAGRIEDEAIDAPAPIRLTRPRGGFSLGLAGSAPRRGRHDLAPPALRIGDPFGIASRRVPLGAGTSILVLPRVEPLGGPSGADGPAVGRRMRGLGELAAGGERESATDPELDGVRPYRPGTRATRIYWPSLARGTELAERHLIAAGESAPLIALDPSDPDSEDDLDRAVRATASLMAHLARIGGCELLIAGARRRFRVGRDPRALMGARAALAVVGSSDGAPRLAAADRRSMVVWVAAAPVPRPPEGLSRGFVVVPRRLAGWPAAFTAAGCVGHEIGAARVRGAAA